jgi:SRSO17 transposase
MNRTYTPELASEVLDRLDAYANRFRDDFNRPRQAQYSGVYLQGLILDGERKSIEPLSRKVTLPTGLAVADLDQALQQFIGQSTWDEQAVWKRYRSVMAETFASPAGIFVIDDTSFPKQGKLSVGVRRQYCGAQGKKANCQVAPSVHYVAPKGHYPLAMRLYLPEIWLDDSKRLDKAGVPQERRRALTKGQIALELLDLVGPRGCPAGSCWPTPAMASPGRSATAWPSGGCGTSWA